MNTSATNAIIKMKLKQTTIYVCAICKHCAVHEERQQAADNHVLRFKLHRCLSQARGSDSLSQWRRAKFDPHRMETPEPIAKKFGTVDYVREATRCARFHANLSTRGFSANAWNITKIFLIYISLFSGNSPTGQTPEWIFTRDSIKDAVSRKGVPFGG